ncbi:MAG TPA: methyltransferase domain-containing protein [Pyrinomonadaceae bacterium]|nr:methyltransferase domain-containing protein [Pyrinomonadaceae bacterium]
MQTEDASQELKVSELMDRIRESVARKEAQGKLSAIDIKSMLRELEPVESVPVSAGEGIRVDSPSAIQLTLPKINLETELIEGGRDEYHVNELLKYHDKEFVSNAYRAVLKREADSSGYNNYLDSLRSGRYNKVDILSALRYSPEGEERGVRIQGLRLPATLRRLYRLPALGYLIQLAVALARLPVLVRNHSQLEAYSFVQREKLVEMIKTVEASVERVAESVRQVDESLRTVKASLESSLEASLRAMEDSLNARLHASEDYVNAFKAMMESQHRLQHQQISALFREQRRLIDEQKELFDLASARHALEQETGALPADMEEQLKQLSQKIEDLRAELARNERATSLLAMSEERHQLDALYASFEDEFRGDKREIKERLRYYLPFLREAGITGGVLDIGCGRGDWLELLAEEGIEAEAVDSNRVLVERCRRSGFRVAQSDALLYLSSQPDASLSAVTAFHVIEHLPFETMVKLLDEIHRVLVPGGLVMLETPSPENLVVAACNFYSDPTHNRPVSAHTLKFILQERGFDSIHLQFIHPVEGSPFETGALRLESLHMWFYGPRDYAIVGSKK